jgi:outer membrane protein assembly factor BamB
MTRSIFIILLSIQWAIPAAAQTDWPLFHGNETRTGYSSAATSAGLVDLWNIDLGSPIYTSPVVAQGRVYVTTADARLVALDAATGTLIWQDVLPSWSESTPAIWNGRLYVGCNDHNIRCIGATTGALIWLATTSSWVESSPLVFSDKVFIGGMNHQLYAYDALSGALSFSLATGGDVLTAPSTDGQNIYFAGDEEKIRAITPDGSAVWTHDAPGAVYGAPVVAESKIVYGSIANGGGLSFNRIEALNASTGIALWQQESSAYDFFYGTPAVGYGNVFMGGFQGTVKAYDLSTGVLLWMRSLGNYALLSSPALSNGVLYIGSTDGQVFALDAFTGAVLDQAATGAFVQSSPAVADGRLFIGSADGRVWAFDLESPVSVTMTPSGTVVPPGGNLSFGVTFTNLTANPQSFLGWLKITRPSGAQLSFGNPVSFNLSSGGTQTVQARITIPLSAPAGGYIMAVHAGPLQTILWDAASFNFSITAADGDPSAPEVWTGEFLDQLSPLLTSGPLQPEEFGLAVPHPNPFNSSTTLRVWLPYAGAVSLKVYDANGRLAAILLEGSASAGIHDIAWNAVNQSSGVYFFRLAAGGQVQVQRGMLIK